MIPPWKEGLLPPGVHWADWEEVEERFGTNEQRQDLLVGLRAALVALAEVGCRTAYIDGSFVTAKERPNDFDACWDPSGVDLDGLDPVLMDLAHPRTAQKDRYGGELFPNVAQAGGGSPFLEFFQVDRDTGRPKGIVAMDLRRLS